MTVTPRVNETGEGGGGGVVLVDALGSGYAVVYWWLRERESKYLGGGWESE